MDGLSKILDSWKIRPKTGQWPRDLQIPTPSPDLLTIIQGVRRCGKSTYMNQLPDLWGVPWDDCTFINFEDPRLVSQLDDTLLDEIKADKGQDRPHYFFLDEIQNVENWERWLRVQVDRPDQSHFIVSGSNATLLAGELGSKLTGRHLSYELFPMSYRERAAITELSVESYLKTGGFPRPLQSSDPQPLLRQYFADIIEKDLRTRLSAKSTLPIQRLIKSTFESVGSELSVRKIAGQIKSTADTVQLYLEAAESAYLLFCCPFFTYSERSRGYRNKKYYAIDTGLRRSLVTRTGSDLGKDFENCVFLELRKKYRNVYYWSGNGEVDFVVETDLGIQPIQVTWQESLERHDRALEEFYSQFPQALEPVFVTSENFSDWMLLCT